MMFSNYLTLNYEKIKICKKGLVYRISKTMFSSTSNFSASHIQPVIWNIAFFQFCTADMGPGENPLHYTQETILSVHFEGDHVGHIPHKKHLHHCHLHHLHSWRSSFVFLCWLPFFLTWYFSSICLILRFFSSCLEKYKQLKFNR